MSIFKDKKIPKHLIIHDEYEIRRRPRTVFLKLMFWTLLLVSLSYVVLQNGPGIG